MQQGPEVDHLLPRVASTNTPIRHTLSHITTYFHLTVMSSNATETQTAVAPVPKPAKKLKPARKQVKPGDVEKVETPQTGKEYSTPARSLVSPTMINQGVPRYLV